MLSSSDRRALLALAHASIRARVTNLPAPDAPRDIPNVPDVAMLSGAFVTIKRDGRLRGCIGYPEADQPLVDVVRRSAASAATEDPRFPPVTADEVPHLRIELSVLGPVEPLPDLAALEIGRHGLIAELGHRRGLLLPQVAVEWGWGPEEFAAQTCVKAGLPPDAWRKGAALFRFDAVVFGDGE